MTEIKRDNVVFLPQTVRFYESKLAEALHAEHYSQAVQMLKVMLSMQRIELHKRREWERLLEGIFALFPELIEAESGPETESEHDEIDEETFRIAALSRKMNDDPDYADRLLARLQRPYGKANYDDVLLVLEQLAYADSDKVNAIILSWLAEQERHPQLQFRAVQTLKQSGLQGVVQLPRNGGMIDVSIQDVPLVDADQPAGLATVFDLLRKQCEAKYPTLGRFLPDIERDFVAYVYGTELYSEMREAFEPNRARMWAAGMHAGLQRNIFHLENVVEICREYDIPSEELGEWRRIYTELERVFVEMFKDRV